MLKRRYMNVMVLCVLVVTFIAGTSFAAVKREDMVKRFDNSQKYFMETMENAKTAIPKVILEKASAIVIVRQLQVGIIIGTKGGGGFAMARNEETGEWSAPAFVKTREGSVGLQFGVQEANAIYVVMAPEVMDKILKGGLKIGIDVSARVGPVGADIELNTDLEKLPEVFVYSKNEGLYAGVNFTAENFDGDKKANKIFYGKDVSTNDILFNNAVEMPEEAVAFSEYLMTY